MLFVVNSVSTKIDFQMDPLVVWKFVSRCGEKEFEKFESRNDFSHASAEENQIEIEIIILFSRGSSTEIN